MTKTYSVFKNKKSNAIIDTIVVIVTLFAFVIVSVIGYNFFTAINTQIEPSINTSATADMIFDTNYAKYPALFDGLAVFVFFALWIMGIVASFMIDSHPIFFALTIILLLFVIIGSIFISNAYESITTSDALSVSAASFTKTNFIMQHLFEATIIIGLSIGFVLFAKTR